MHVCISGFRKDNDFAHEKNFRVKITGFLYSVHSKLALAEKKHLNFFLKGKFSGRC